MGWFAGAIIFIVIWWVVLFTVLPWWARAPKKPDAGHADSAPENPRIGLKFLITTLISIVLWFIVIALISNGIIGLR